MGAVQTKQCMRMVCIYHRHCIVHRVLQYNSSYNIRQKIDIQWAEFEKTVPEVSIGHILQHYHNLWTFHPDVYTFINMLMASCKQEVTKF